MLDGRATCARSELLPIIERGSLLANETQPGFVHQRGGLKRLTGSFTGKPGRWEPPEFVINEDEQFIGGFRVACFNGSQHYSGVTHVFRPKTRRP